MRISDWSSDVCSSDLPGRCREVFVGGIIEDLQWLGLGWDGEVVRQSARMHLYSDALARLRDMGLIYPCFCKRSEIAAEIAASGGAPHGQGGRLYSIGSASSGSTWCGEIESPAGAVLHKKTTKQ